MKNVLCGVVMAMLLCVVAMAVMPHERQCSECGQWTVRERMLKIDNEGVSIGCVIAQLKTDMLTLHGVADARSTNDALPERERQIWQAIAEQQRQMILIARVDHMLRNELGLQSGDGVEVN